MVPDNEALKVNIHLNKYVVSTTRVIVERKETFLNEDADSRKDWLKQKSKESLNSIDDL